VHLFLNSGAIFVQNPLQYCSLNKAPSIAQEKLTQLSELNLGASSSTKLNENNTPKYIGMTSQIDPGTSSFKDFDLNLITEEYNENIKKNKKTKST